MGDTKELLITDIAKMEFDVKEILKLIRWHYYSMCWGFNTPTIYKDTVCAFKVNWFVHKGWVYINLDWNDEFAITFTKSNRTTIVKEVKWVYLEDLISILDSEIEKKWNMEEYKKTVEKDFSWIILN